ncbi:type I secretion system permease/ATPase [Variovorax paradoxus]|uniref:type I secretion system permease/ATPase n=1 Tax=Variovorax paradoxus TaxID=34073 RepID=UPI002786CA1F|nr:type I secretion system permease/ATPase [Variovorax paradoxus]MDP9928990.1 ATP-binding cassette subfamily C protein/ATP-binding cassette subfamily C protein EexD [Variovorax paradoxus]
MKPLLQLLKRPLLFVGGFSFFVNLLLLAPALFMLQVFDRVLTSQSRETLLVLLLGVAVALGLMLMLDYLRSRLQGVAGNLIAEQLSPVVAKVMLVHTARRAERAPCEGLRDVAALRNLFSSQGLLALFDVPWAFVYVAVIWLAHPMLGMAAAAASLLMLVLAVVNDRITRRDIEALQKEAARATRYLESSMQNAELAQSLGMGEAVIGRWRTLNAGVAALQGPTARKSVAMAALTRATRQAVQVLLQALGAYLVITGEGTPGILVACTILLGRALAPVEQVVGSWRVLAEGRLAFARLSEVLGAAERQPQRMALPAPSGRLHAEGLVFRPSQGERMILASVSLSLEPGESLAITGASGAGKSTLVRLLTGLWRPHAGVVRLDDVDIAQWPREELGPWLGYVPQDVELFAGTVADNIARLGEVDPDKVVQAAQRAGVHALILTLPEGYDTVVDNMGVMLSPGQRQRIALARALYGNPKLLVLDEPNSNLDGAGELALGEALKALRGQVTVIVVTHRSALVQHMDKLMVLEAGRVKQYGPVAEVMQAIRRPGQNPGGAQVVMMPARASEVAR